MKGRTNSTAPGWEFNANPGRAGHDHEGSSLSTIACVNGKAEATTSRPSLSAVVPATDRPDSLARCLQAIREANDPPEEVVVVDECELPGPAAARNDGAHRATGDILVFVDADVLPHADAFERVRSAFESSPELIAVFGSYDDAPEATGTVSSFRNLLHHHVHQQAAGRGDDVLGGSRRRSPRRVPRRRRVRSRAVPDGVDRGHRARRPSCARRRDPARSAPARHPPEALDAPQHGPDRFLPARHSLGFPAAARASGHAGSEPRLAPPPQRARLRGLRGGGIGAARPVAFWSAGRSWRSTARSMRSCSGDAVVTSPRSGSGCTRSTTSWGSQPRRPRSRRTWAGGY